MAEPDGSRISAQLWRLPGRLLLALINGTAILVIVAAIVALVAIAPASTILPKTSPQR